jgi:COX assembly protein 2
MHPPLTLENHPICRDVVIAFKRCHRDNPLGKFIGACNEEKWALDRCLREQKLWKSKRNLEKARASKERLRKKLEEERERDKAVDG